MIAITMVACERKASCMSSELQNELETDVREAARVRLDALSGGDTSNAWATSYVDTAAEHGLTLEQFRDKVVAYSDSPDLDVIAAKLQQQGVELG